MRPVQQAVNAFQNLLGLDPRPQQPPPNPLAGGVGSWIGQNTGPGQPIPGLLGPPPGIQESYTGNAPYVPREMPGLRPTFGQNQFQPPRDLRGPEHFNLATPHGPQETPWDQIYRRGPPQQSQQIPQTHMPSQQQPFNGGSGSGSSWDWVDHDDDQGYDDDGLPTNVGPPPPPQGARRARFSEIGPGGGDR